MRYAYITSNKLLLFFILFFIGLISINVAHAETYTFVAKWGSFGSEDGRFYAPWGVAMDSSGNVYVVDENNHRIQKFSSDGTFITKWGSYGTNNGCFNYPRGVAIDSSGNVYVTDTVNGCIQKFSSNGTFITKWGSQGSGSGKFNGPEGVAVDSSGNVYVADFYNNLIQKFDSNGNYLTQWGSYGIKDGQLNHPTGVAVDSSGNVYVADSDNGRIQKFYSNGTFITKWGYYGSEEGELYYPTGVAVDSSGNVYVADAGNYRIQKFSSNGTFITKWGSQGSDDGQFIGPRGIAVDSLGNVYVADWVDNHRIQKFSSKKLLLPSANFSINLTEGYVPLSVQFKDQSENASNVSWDFESDGIIDSTDRNPIHVYKTPGNYTINLIANNTNGTASKSAAITVLKEQPLPVFPATKISNNITSGYAPLNVQIVGLLENATGINWDFGDENNSFANFTLEHLFSIPGTYNISINVTNENGTSSNVVAINVLKPPVLPAAYFKSNVTRGYAPLSVQFTDMSTNATEWSWNFGDGTNSTEKNPMHTFPTVGNYTVNLTATNEDGTNSGFATITVLQKPVSSWEYSPQEPVCEDTLNISGNTSPWEKVNASVTFEKTVNVSQGKFEYILENVIIPEGLDNLFAVEASGVSSLNLGVKTIIWVTKSSEALGDNATISQSNVPPGSYTVKVYGNAGEGVSKVNLKITAFQHIKADSNGNFSYSYNTTGVPPGNFEVEIGDNTKEITLKPKELEQPSLVLPVANFSFNTTEGIVPLTIQFNDSSKNATSINWDFGDGINSTENNPMHTYSAAGNYTVSLTASNENGTDSKLAAINVKKATGSYAYITNGGDNSVSVIDTATNTLKAMVPVGSYPEGIAVSPDGTKVYVTNINSNNVSVIDTATNIVLATIYVGNGPYGIAITPDGKKVYVANSRYPGTIVSVIDTATNTVIDRVNVYYAPFGIAITPDGKYVYVLTSGTNTVVIIDTYTNKVTGTVTAGYNIGPYGIAIAPDGSKVYLANSVNNNISVIDTNTKNLTATVSVGNQPNGIAFNPDGTNVYVTNYGDNNVSVIDTATNTVTATINMGSQPWGITVSPDGHKLYVVSRGTKSFFVIDTKTYIVTATMPVGNYPSQIAIVPSQMTIPPLANFTSDVTQGYAPLSVQFTDLSTNATECNWNFGDGTNSTEQNPKHTYYAAGNYTVNLTTSNGENTDYKLATITVLEKPVPILPIANFTANITEGTAPLTVNFTDRSSGNPTEWEWSFGDGNTSTEQNPVNMFSNEGIYNVTLFATNGNGSSNKESMNIKVYPLPVRPVASFIAALNIPIKFTDTSSNSPTRWYWNFGDGTNSTEQNPVHIFSSDGIYNVTMVATNAAGSSYVKSMNIKVDHTLIPPVANFTSKQIGALQVQFNDTSLNEVLERTWTFGDGSTSTDTNPTHVYAAAGTYVVNLTASNVDGLDMISKAIDVNGTYLGPLKANFTAVPKTGHAPLTVNFTDKSVNATSITWRFGDKGAMSNESNPSYVYVKAGVYFVQLIATNGNESNITFQAISVKI